MSTSSRAPRSASRVAYVNGRYLSHRRAAVHIEDRGYQFADGVYEVIAVCRGRLLDWDRHQARLTRSLTEMAMAWPVSVAALPIIVDEIIRRNRIGDMGMVYLQITRGVSPRSHAFPATAASALVVTGRRLPAIDPDRQRRPVEIVTLPDTRWKRCDIKSIALLANVLAKNEAVAGGADEAWLVDDDGMITEGTTSNAFIVDRNGVLITHPAGSAILNGVTRQVVLDLARDAGVPLIERPFSVDEAIAAREAFLTSTTAMVRPVGWIDGVAIGNVAIGAITEDLLRRYWAHIDRQTER